MDVSEKRRRQGCEVLIQLPKKKIMEEYRYFKDNSNVIIQIKAGDLANAIDYAISETKKAFEAKQVPEQYLTRKQTAEMLGVDISTLWRWKQQQYLNDVEIGGKRRYKMSDVKRILEG
jgi:DNA-binding transcriptional MerR regulator